MKKVFFIVSAIGLALALFSCNSSNDNDKSYPYSVRMTDGPGPYDAVYIDLQSVEVTGNNGQSVVLNTNEGIYNLLDFSNGLDTLIATSILNDADVKQIRLILGQNNTIVVDGVTHPLSTPSAEQSGLKLQVNQTLEADIENTILIDFDANKSIVLNGNGTYILKPVLRTIVTASSGIIKGTLLPADTMAVVSATSSTGVEYTSNTNAFGQFQILGLPPGTYTITITPTLPLLPITVMDVTVEAGTTTDLGVVEL